jgi:SnoaL-like domain
VRAAFLAFNERRFADFATYMTDDIVETYPQSGERLDGKIQQRAMHEAFPSPPTFTIRRILRDGDLATVEVDEAYEDGSTWKTTFIFQLREGLIAGLTAYFGEPFPAPDWRKPYRSVP